MKNNRKFYQKLPTHTILLQHLLQEESLFEPLPADWYVVVVDIEKSTEAVENGFHHDVNLVATGSIIVVLNKLKEKYQNLTIPYFFGGDGATFLVPPLLWEEIASTLLNYRRHVQQNFDLNLRVGALPVEDIYDQQIQLKIAKLKLNDYLTIPVVLGNGMKYSEALIKTQYKRQEDQSQDVRPVDLTGMECRWNEIAPPEDEEKILCLLITCPQESEQGRVYQEVVAEMDRIFGRLEERQPISVGRLKLSLTIAKLRREMYVRVGKYDIVYLLKSWLISFIGRYYFKVFKEGKKYLFKLSQLSSSLMIDGNINSVISGTPHEIEQLISYLQEREAAGDLKYGTHITHSSIMSCYVLDLKKNHIHFVDGTEGGYTTASKMFKAKLL